MPAFGLGRLRLKARRFIRPRRRGHPTTVSGSTRRTSVGDPSKVPPLFFYDELYEPVTTLLEDHTSDSGHGWEPRPPLLGNITISAGGGVASAQPSARYSADAAPPSPDYAVEAILEHAADLDTLAICVRMQSTGAHYALFYGSGTTWFLNHYAANGAKTTLGSLAMTQANGDVSTVRIEAQGMTIRGLRNGVVILTATDSAIAAAGAPGLANTTGATGVVRSVAAADLTARRGHPTVVFGPARRTSIGGTNRRTSVA